MEEIVYTERADNEALSCIELVETTLRGHPWIANPPSANQPDRANGRVFPLPLDDPKVMETGPAVGYSITPLSDAGNIEGQSLYARFRAPIMAIGRHVLETPGIAAGILEAMQHASGENSFGKIISCQRVGTVNHKASYRGVEYFHVGYIFEIRAMLRHGSNG